MTEARFIAVQGPSDDECAVLEALAPEIPYYTKAYRDALQASGRDVWLLGAESDTGLTTGCLAEVQSGRIGRRVHIQSTPGEAPPAFWRGLSEYCGKHGVSRLSLGSVGTTPAIPDFGRVLERRERFEYWVDLSADDLTKPMRAEQRRVYRRAAERGLELHVPDIEAGLRQHHELTTFSLERRRARGESIPYFEQSALPRAMLESKLARLYECRHEGEVLGSVIITIASGGAHGYSAGYARSGLKLGAGVFVNLETFGIMKEEGKRLFNLGDAPRDSGLATFKRGLGSRQVESEAAVLDVAGPVRSFLIELSSGVRSAGRSIRRKLGG